MVKYNMVFIKKKAIFKMNDSQNKSDKKKMNYSNIILLIWFQILI
jgi:hypothetical protein